MPDSLEFPSRFAIETPDHPAIINASDGQVVTYAQLDDRSLRIANLMRSLGLGVGDHLAVLVDNRPEFLEIVWAGLRSGLLVTPINWHLGADEAAFIIDDCEARVLFASGSVAEVGATIAASDSVSRLEGRFSVGGPIEGFVALDDAIADQPTTPPSDECEGNWMFYSSGTTARPKGVVPAFNGQPIGTANGFAMLVKFLYGGDETSVYLSPAPLYHAAPAAWTTTMHRLGATSVVMDRFEPHAVLAAIEKYRVTHAQFVPTHLVRLLKLSEQERARYDLSSLRCVVHAAAPCPPEVKRAAMEWLGPIVYEYYSGSEGVGFCAIGPQEWLERPGSVGKCLTGPVHIVGPDGEEVAVGEEGEVWFEPPGRFEYQGNEQATAQAYDHRGWSTLGEMGRVDEEGYLYLTGRASNMIVSGGVNISPQESEDVLIAHPAVADVVVLGVPHPDFGEAVRAVVQPVEGALARAGEEALGAELIEACRAQLSRYKCPTSVVFVEELPRLPTGKLVKRKLPASLLR